MKVHLNVDICTVQNEITAKQSENLRKRQNNNLLKTKRILNIVHTDIQTKWWPVFKFSLSK